MVPMEEGGGEREGEGEEEADGCNAHVSRLGIG